MKYVYLLESVVKPEKRYIGIISDLNTRLKKHNTVKSPHTAKFKPWKVVVVVRFSNDQKAIYGGSAFAKRHFRRDSVTDKTTSVTESKPLKPLQVCFANFAKHTGGIAA